MGEMGKGEQIVSFFKDAGAGLAFAANKHLAKVVTECYTGGVLSQTELESRCKEYAPEVAEQLRWLADRLKNQDATWNEVKETGPGEYKLFEYAIKVLKGDDSVLNGLPDDWKLGIVKYVRKIITPPPFPKR